MLLVFSSKSPFLCQLKTIFHFFFYQILCIWLTLSPRSVWSRVLSRYWIFSIKRRFVRDTEPWLLRCTQFLGLDRHIWNWVFSASPGFECPAPGLGWWPQQPFQSQCPLLSLLSALQPLWKSKRVKIHTQAAVLPCCEMDFAEPSVCSEQLQRSGVLGRCFSNVFS